MKKALFATVAVALLSFGVAWAGETKKTETAATASGASSAPATAHKATAHHKKSHASHKKPAGDVVAPASTGATQAPAAVKH